MNIVDQLEFSTEKPAVLAIRRTEKVNLMAIGLLQGQRLTKHKANIPTMLTVLQGRIEFVLDDAHIWLNAFDIFEIPVNVEHEVIGHGEQNVFTLTQEK